MRFRIQHGNQHCYAICTRTDDPRACYIVFRSIEANTRLRWPEGDVDRFLEQFNTAVDAIWLGGKFFREQGEVRYRATIDRADNMSANAIVDFLMEKTRSLIAVAGILEFASKQATPLDRAMIEKLVSIYADPE